MQHVVTGGDGNVAFKCTFHDGGRLGYIGYDGTCSIENMCRNVRGHDGANKGPFSQLDGNACKKYLDRDCRGKKPRHPCLESRLLQSWQFGGGLIHSGDRAGEPKRMLQVRPGKVALFTTRFPGTPEIERCVFAIGRIERLEDDRNLVVVDRECCLSIPEETARKPSLGYWRFMHFKGEKPGWDRPLFRYPPDRVVAGYLDTLFWHLRSYEECSTVDQLLQLVGGVSIDVFGVSVARNLNAKEDRDIWSKEKHGPGGEGGQHLQLKEYIAANPEMLGLGTVQRVFVEHPFITRDRADVVMQLVDGTYVVVEVEVAGERSTMIGAHQAIKYRALILAQHDSKRVPHAFLVAQSIPAATKKFCKRHGVKTLEI